MQSIKTIKNIEEFSLEVYSREVLFPSNVKITIEVDEITFENYILTKRVDVINKHTLKYNSSHGIDFYIKLVS